MTRSGATPSDAQQVELGEADGPARGVGRDGQAGREVGARGGPERALLGGREVAVAADLADDAGADAAAVDAVPDVPDDEVGDLVGGVARRTSPRRGTG